MNKIQSILSLSRILRELNFIKESENLKTIIVKNAASKMRQLKQLGLNDNASERLDRSCGGLSLWMAYVLIKHIISNSTQDSGAPMTKEMAASVLNESINRSMQGITSIMDWISVGLDGEYKEYKNASYSELLRLSQDWHDSLSADEDGEINYNEVGKIILDLRDSNGVGYYWVNLGTSSCNEESRRMGHCGTSGYGNTIYSLREDFKVGANLKKNRSVLTASISDNGIIKQLKGPKNSKPKEEYHKYIVELLKLKVPSSDLGSEKQDNFIKGFGAEYASELDFHLLDLDDESLSNVLEHNKSIIDDISTALQLYKRKKLPIDIKNKFSKITIEITKNFLENIIDFDRRGDIDSDFAYKLLFGEFDSWENNFSPCDFDQIKYIYEKLDPTNKEEFDILFEKEFNQEFGDNDQNKNIIFVLNKYDYNSIKTFDSVRALCSASNDLDSDLQIEAIQNTVIGTIKEFGIYSNDDGASPELTVNIFRLIDSISDEELAEVSPDNDGDISSFAKDLIINMVDGGYMDKERINLDLNYIRTRTPSNLEFNDYVSNHLSMI